MSALQIAPLLKLPDQITPLQGGYNKVGRSLEHVGRVLQRLHRGIVHAVEADDPAAVIEGDHHKGVDGLLLQILVLEGVALMNILQTLDDNMLAHAEVPIPAGAHLRRDMLQIADLRLHAVGGPLVGVVVIAGLAVFKDVSTIPVQRFPQVFEQYLQGLVRRLRQQRDAQALVDDGLQVLDALYIVVMGFDGRSALSAPFRKSPRMIHTSASCLGRSPAIAAAANSGARRRAPENAVC